MRKTTCCNKCYHTIDIEDYIEDYYEHEEEETIAVVECSNCKNKNAVYWWASVDFYSRDADNDEIKKTTIIHGENN